MFTTLRKIQKHRGTYPIVISARTCRSQLPRSHPPLSPSAPGDLRSLLPSHSSATFATRYPTQAIEPSTSNATVFVKENHQIRKNGRKPLLQTETLEPVRVNASTALEHVGSEISGSDVRILEGHSSEVCACAWSPSGSLLASGLGIYLIHSQRS